MEQEFLSDPENWFGLDFELSLNTQLDTTDHVFQVNILQRILQYPEITGVWASKDKISKSEPGGSELLVSNMYIYGFIKFHSQTFGWRLEFIRNQYERKVVLGIPVQMIVTISERSFQKRTIFIECIKEFFISIGVKLYSIVSYDFGLIGEDSSGISMSTTDLSKKTLTTRKYLLVPTSQFQQAGIAPFGTYFTEGIWWTGEETIWNDWIEGWPY